MGIEEEWSEEERERFAAQITTAMAPLIAGIQQMNIDIAKSVVPALTIVAKAQEQIAQQVAQSFMNPVLIAKLGELSAQIGAARAPGPALTANLGALNATIGGSAIGVGTIRRLAERAAELDPAEVDASSPWAMRDTLGLAAIIIAELLAGVSFHLEVRDRLILQLTTLLTLLSVLLQLYPLGDDD
jgi:hypothetical protein